MNTPKYYKKNGLSPNEAFEQGLLSKEEYKGFLKGNIIKYVVRCEYKDNPVKDLEKAGEYCRLLKKLYKSDYYDTNKVQ